ncbi:MULTISPECIES: hypothetical protein [unclassified Streptomyces]|uniref:hypothetical protein n=1 Tax=unclassified Streptomyces TaxID=2593676 RepID=UPI001F544D28|nr:MULTISPECIES: hypothetical protein [unclassified Streptomyces]
MHTLSTDAERAEAVALVQDRQRQLSVGGLPKPARADIPALFRDPQSVLAGLFEEGVLLACMIRQRTSRHGWDEGPCLFLSCFHTLPGHGDNAVQLITLWTSGFATRLGLLLVRAEVFARDPLHDDPIAPFLRCVIDMGWNLRGTGKGQHGEPVARLELIADCRPGLRALIGCQVQTPRPAPA